MSDTQQKGLVWAHKKPQETHPQRFSARINTSAAKNKYAFQSEVMASHRKVLFRTSETASVHPPAGPVTQQVTLSSYAGVTNKQTKQRAKSYNDTKVPFIVSAFP